MNGRERTRLRKAREDGYLDARCKENDALVQAYGVWCWRLKIPMVWLERRSRYSRFGRVRLEMFTSSNRLTTEGQEDMRAICAPANTASRTRVSPHDACWEHVALANAKDLAHTIFRAAIRPDNHEKNQVRPGRVPQRKTGKVLQMA